MEYNIRTPKAKDLFRMSNILNKIGLSEFKTIINNPDVKEAIQSATTKDKRKQNTDKLVSVGASVVIDVVDIIIRNMDKVESDLYELVGSLTLKKPEEVADMDMDEFISVLVSLFKSEKFKDFFMRLSK